jgi:hypothetical protein
MAHFRKVRAASGSVAVAYQASISACVESLEAAAAAGQPDEVLPRLAELVRCRVPRAGGQELACGPGPHPRQQPPGGELAQGLRVLRVGDGLDLAAVPALEQEDLPVDGDQRAGGHEQVAQVGGGAPARQVKQGLVAERDVPVRQAAQIVPGMCVVAQPVPAQCRPRHGHQVLEEPREQGATWPVPSSNISVSRARSSLRARRAAEGLHAALSRSRAGAAALGIPTQARPAQTIRKPGDAARLDFPVPLQPGPLAPQSSGHVVPQPSPRPRSTPNVPTRAGPGR